MDTKRSTFDEEMRGVLFRNDDKKPDSNQPDYRGKCQINGAEFKLAGWVRTPKDGGNKYLSLALEPKDGELAKSAPETQQSDDNLPF